MIDVDGEYYPVVREYGDLNIHGAYPFYSSDLLYEEGYVISKQILEDRWRYQIVKILDRPDGQQYFVGDLVDLVSNKIGEELLITDYLKATADDRCDSLYADKDFNDLSRSDLELLINNGCMDSAFDPHNGYITVKFAGGHTAKVKVEDELFFSDLRKNCGDACKYSRWGIE